MVKIEDAKGRAKPARGRQLFRAGSKLFHKADSYATASRARPYAGLADGELKERIDRQGRELVASSGERTLEDYRELIREALERAVGQGLELSRESSYSGDPKMFASITVVNSKLLDLAEEVRKTQAETIRLAKLVEEIKGLVADLLG
ncbi:MAG: YaaR family protein [bacterium]